MDRLTTPEARFASVPDFDVPVARARSRTRRAATPLAMADASTPARRAAARPSCSCTASPRGRSSTERSSRRSSTQGHRVVAPDLIGFGRSDKPAVARRAHLRPARRVAARGALRPPRARPRHGLRPGLGRAPRAAARRRAPRARSPASRSATRGCRPATGARPTAFLAWQQYSQTTERFDVGRIVAGGCATRARRRRRSPPTTRPFPDDAYKEGPRQLPDARADDARQDPASAANRAAWAVARAVRPTVPVLLLGRRRDHEGRGPPLPRAGARRRRARPTRRSRARATSSRRTRARELGARPRRVHRGGLRPVSRRASGTTL